jgi:hypothetical protein
MTTRNKEHKREYNRQYREKNRTRIKADAQAWRSRDAYCWSGSARDSEGFRFSIWL